MLWTKSEIIELFFRCRHVESTIFSPRRINWELKNNVWICFGIDVDCACLSYMWYEVMKRRKKCLRKSTFMFHVLESWVLLSSCSLYILFFFWIDFGFVSVFCRIKLNIFHLISTCCFCIYCISIEMRSDCRVFLRKIFEIFLKNILISPRVEWASARHQQRVVTHI